MDAHSDFNPESSITSEIEQRVVTPVLSLKKNGFEAGQRVKHNYWGLGTVLSVSGKGLNEKVRVSFDRFGIKKLKSNMANLKKI